jgi:hypothetical protein
MNFPFLERKQLKEYVLQKLATHLMSYNTKPIEPSNLNNKINKEQSDSHEPSHKSRLRQASAENV